jgi:hypothetical protein
VAAQPSDQGVPYRNQREGDFHPPTLLLGRKHVAVEHQPVLIDFRPIILADHRDALDVGAECFGLLRR